jgi:hypothetical protein
MARYRRGRKHRHGSGKTTIPIAIAVPLAAVAIGTAKNLMNGQAGRDVVLEQFSGYDGQGHWVGTSAMFQVYGPIAAGFAAHYIASKVGVNRALGRAKVPMIRI